MPPLGSKRLKICSSEPSDSEVGGHSAGSNDNVRTEPAEVVSPRIFDSPYTSLESMEFGIRLLELAPGSFEDIIRLRVITKDLGDGGDHTYEALSYVWGVDHASTEVCIDGIPVKVTSNLSSALRHLRGQLLSRVLWIDALSINQRDVQERNTQVRNMDKIYAQATRVIVWLGEVHTKDVHLRAMLGAMQFSFLNAQPRVDLFDYICSIIAIIDFDATGSRSPRDCAFAALGDLVSRPWFSRLWVVQELALSRSATVQIGTYSFSWAAFEQFLRYLPHYKVEPAKHRELVKAAGQVMKVPSVAGFHSQLHRTLHLSTTDPRDKIYGILGISAFDTSRINPDYNKSSGRVYTEALALLLSEGIISTYWYAPLHPPRGSYYLDEIPDLPSWVPDFRMSEFKSPTSPPMEPADELHRRYHTVDNLCEEEWASKYKSASIKHTSCVPGSRRPHILPATSMDFTTLFTTGSRAKTIIWTSGSLLADLGPASTTSDVQELMRRLYSSVTRIEYVDPEIFLSVLVRSIRGNDYTSTKVPPEVATELVSPTFQLDNMRWQLRSSIHWFATAIKKNAAHRTLLLTDGDHIGLSYHPTPLTGICLGDNVVELFRSPCCSLHFILRPTDEVYHKMINVTSMWHTTIPRFYDECRLDVDWDFRRADIHMREICDDDTKVLEENFGLMVSNDSITPEYLEEFRAQYRYKRYKTELYAIK